MAATPYVLVLGGANMDITASTNHLLRHGDSTPGHVGTAPGGVARNIAQNLARLGHDTRLITAVGDDPPGHSLLTATRLAGVDVSGCLRVADIPTASYVSVHGAGGQLAVAVNDMQVLERITPEALAPYAEAAGLAAALVVDCNLSVTALGWLFAHCGDAPVFVDAVSAFKCTRVLPWLRQVHTLKVNRQEAQALSGLPLSSQPEVETAARWLHRQGVRNVVVSLGGQGLYHSAASPGPARGHTGTVDRAACAAPADGGWQAAVPVACINTSGAGDALMAGLVHSHLVGEPLARAAAFASACAALTLTVGSANHPEFSIERVAALMALPDVSRTS